MTGSSKVVIGVPLYNGARYLTESLESLLSQTHRDFALVLNDDCSTDATPEIVQRYASIDGRITYRRNPARLGMVQNWRKTFELALDLFPSAEYFAWGSDHDVWHPRWLTALLAELERFPELVLAYPLNTRVSATGELVRGPWMFDTFGIKAAAVRLVRSCWAMSAGNMVYGLFRTPALRQAGVFRPVLNPDRLLLAEASLNGQFKQIPEILWHRRFTELANRRRQRAALFPAGAPVYSYLPWWLTHTAVLGWNFGLRRTRRSLSGGALGLLYALAYLIVSLAVVVRTSLLAKYARRTAQALRLVVHQLRVRFGRQRMRGYAEAALGRARRNPP
jgi:glycosyltransferase involved in cell wall biosynthesis